MKILEIKTGSICIYKQYGWWKIIYAKLMRKKLPYNKYFVYYYDGIFVETVDYELSDCDNYIILEPKKLYNKNEERNLRTENIKRLITPDKTPEIEVINTIRPKTVDLDHFNVEDLLCNKYYRVLYDSKRKNN